MSDTLKRVQERPKGLLDPKTAIKTFRLDRYHPSSAMAPFLDHYWMVEWDLRGKSPFVQRTLPYPCVNLVFDTGKTAVFGVVRGAFDYRLTGKGRILGLRFRPGAFRGFLGAPVRSITGRTLGLDKILDCDPIQAEQRVLGAGNDALMIAAADSLLASRLPAPDPTVERLQSILSLAREGALLDRVSQLAKCAGMGVRALEQMFSDYVGVSPKWVLRRFRLQEAADRLTNGERVNLSALAQSLGYYDQAHFTRDFQRLVGKPPDIYRTSV